jgi:hypothetical protein
VAQTCPPNSRARKIDVMALPQPRSSTFIPGSTDTTEVGDSINQSAFGPISFSNTQSGCEARDYLAYQLYN